MWLFSPMVDAIGVGPAGVAARRAVRVADGDASFAAWYEAEYPRLLAAMVAFTGDLHIAQDVTAEAFARALGSWGRVEEMASPAGWAYRVAANLARRRARRAAIEQRLLRRTASTTTGTTFGTDPATEPSGLAFDVRAAVAALPPRQRLAVALRYGAGCSEAEVADAMGIALGTASATLAQARRALATALTSDPTDANDTNDTNDNDGMHATPARDAKGPT